MRGNTLNNHLTRRSLVGATAALGAAAALTRAGFAQDSTPPASPASGEWSYTDARGITIAQPQAPTRVVAMTYAAQSLFDFGFEVIGHYGIDPLEPGRESIGNLDLDAIPFLGPYDGFDVEKLIELEADLVVDYSWGEGETASLWYLSGDALTQVEALAPVVGIAMAGVSSDVSIRQVEALAASLGADVETSQIVASRDAYLTASEALTAATEANPGIKVMALQGDADMIYAANPDYHADLLRFKELGVTFTEIEVDPESDNFWGIYSGEDLGTLPTDVYLTLGDLSGIGVWNALPAVRANQVSEWIFSRRLSYIGFTANFDNMTELIANAEIVSE